MCMNILILYFGKTAQETVDKFEEIGKKRYIVGDVNSYDFEFNDRYFTLFINMIYDDGTKVLLYDATIGDTEYAQTKIYSRKMNLNLAYIPNKNGNIVITGIKWASIKELHTKSINYNAEEDYVVDNDMIASKDIVDKTINWVKDIIKYKYEYDVDWLQNFCYEAGDFVKLDTEINNIIKNCILIKQEINWDGVLSGRSTLRSK